MKKPNSKGCFSAREKNEDPALSYLQGGEKKEVQSRKKEITRSACESGERREAGA